MKMKRLNTYRQLGEMGVHCSRSQHHEETIAIKFEIEDTTRGLWSVEVMERRDHLQDVAERVVTIKMFR